MDNILEMLMVICFGCSWPLNLYKAWIARTARGTSPVFYSLICIGYILGLISKAIKMQQGIHTPFYIWFFYTLNAVMVLAGILIWFRNRKLDMEQERRAVQEMQGASVRG